MNENSTSPTSKEDPPQDTADLARRWAAELKAAEEVQRQWWERGEKVVLRYLDERPDSSKANTQRLNLFPSNTQTLEALLFGKTPEVGAQRRFADTQDDTARVAGEMLERLLNTDIEDEADVEQEALRNALRDRLIPGMGSVRLRYDMGETTTKPGTPAQTDPMSGVVLAQAVPEQEQRPNERVCVDYVYWKDELWSPCRVYADLRWRSWKAKMSRDQLVERFGKEIGDKIQLDSAGAGGDSPNDDLKVKDHLGRADVYEIWSKDDKTVYWINKSYPDLLDQKPDPLGLKGFWPSPRPMYANLTTSKLIPQPDFVLAQDLYNEIDDLATRAMWLEQCIRVRGLYDKNNEELKRILVDGSNEMIAVDGWQAFAEKGGLQGAIDWFPLEMVTQALDAINAQIDRKIAQLYQITGMSDIMRGQANEQATATEQAIKARFASVRVQTLQDEFARFASDAQKIKGEIMALHFDPQNMIDRSNILRTPDAPLAQAAVQLIKSDVYQWRISVNPDSVSLTDFAALKQERFEFAQTIGSYFQNMIPMVQMLAGANPGAGQAAVQFVIAMAQSMVAGLKGAAEMEGIFDQFVAKLEQAAQQAAAQPPQPPPPDPKVEAEKVKAQAAQSKAGAEQLKAKADVIKTGMEMQQAAQEHRQSMQQGAMDHALGIQSMEAKERANALKGINAVTQEGPT